MARNVDGFTSHKHVIYNMRRPQHFTPFQVSQGTLTSFFKLIPKLSFVPSNIHIYTQQIMLAYADSGLGSITSRHDCLALGLRTNKF